MPQHVIVREYDSRYPALYEEEAASLSRILGESLLSIHHIGSTAVPGLKSKPIIDIMASVRSLADVDGKKGELERIGYEYLGEFGIKGRRYLRKGGNERTHQVYIFEAGDKGNLMRHLAVRDYLIAHEDVREEYGRLKEALALRFPYDIEGYCDGKEAFVRRMERNALREYARQGKDIGIELCPFRREWIDELLSIFRSSVRESCGKEYSEEEREAWSSSADKDRWIDELESHYSLVAFFGEEAIGFGDIEEDGHLNLLYVNPDFQGMGVATRISDLLERHAGGRVRTEASLTAKGFFLRRGYEVEREETVFRKGVALRRFRMRKGDPR